MDYVTSCSKQVDFTKEFRYKMRQFTSSQLHFVNLTLSILKSNFALASDFSHLSY